MAIDLTVTGVVSASDTAWEIHFADGQVLVCSKKPPRDEAHVDALIAAHEQANDDPDHTERMKAMINAVRVHEEQGN